MFHLSASGSDSVSRTVLGAICHQGAKVAAGQHPVCERISQPNSDEFCSSADSESPVFARIQDMFFNGCVVASTVLSRARRPSVGKEFWAIIGVGAALGALILTGHSNIDSRFDSVEGQFDRVYMQFDRVYEQFDRVDARFASIETRLDRTDSRIDSIDTRLGNIDRRLGRVEGYLFGIEQEAEPTP